MHHSLFNRVGIVLQKYCNQSGIIQAGDFNRVHISRITNKASHIMDKIGDKVIKHTRGPTSESGINVSALEPFLRPLNTITSVILNANRSGCRLYLYIIFFNFVLFVIQSNYTYILLTIYYCTYLLYIYLECHYSYLLTSSFVVHLA